jgi:hypothetical protein
MNHGEHPMNDDEHPDDSALTAELVDSLAEVAVPERPPLAAITDRGRVHRRRRRAGFAGLGGATAAVVIALALGLAAVFGVTPAGGTGPVGTAAFTLTSYVNGTVGLKLSQVFDPAGLQRALANHGIPALVKTDIYCSSHPAVPAPAGRRVLSIPRGIPDIIQSGNWPVKPSQLAPFVDPITMVLDPAAMPSGTELFIGHYNLGHTIFVGVIYTSSHTCINGQPPAVARLDRPPSAGHA